MSGQTCRLLIIATDAGLRCELRQSLGEDSGAGGRYTLVEAGTGAAGARAVLSPDAAPDCVLLAHEPPGLDALEVLAALRKDRPVPPCPVVALAVSSAGGDELARALLRAGAMESVGRGSPGALSRAIEDAMARFAPWRAAFTAQDRAGNALHVSQRRYQTLFESIDDGFCLMQLLFDARGRPVDYRMLETNAAFETHTGLRNPAGRTLRELVPVINETWLQCYAEVARTGRSTRFEDYTPSVDRWFEVYVTPGGEPGSQQVAILLKNITERKLAEQALRESEARAHQAAARAEAESRLLDAVLEAAPAGIIVTGANGELVRMNPANERLWGASPRPACVEEYREWKGWWADGSERHGRRLEPHEWAMSRALRGELVSGDIVEIEPFDSPGIRRTMLNSAAPVRDGAGRILGGVVVQTDISARVEAETAVRRSEERFEALADNISQLAWMADETGSLFWYNQRWFDYTGTTFEEVKGSGWRRVHHPDHVERVAERFMRHIASGEVWEDTFPLRSRTGEYRWFLSRARPIRDASGRVRRWFGTNTDITAQLQAEAQLKDALRARDEFLSIASHELRTPLTSMKLQLEMTRRRLERGDPSAYAPEQVSKLVEQGNHQVARLARLVNDMLDIARIQTGRLVIEPGRVDAVELTREVLERLGPHLTESGTPATLEAPERLEAEWDRFRIEQVVTNLLTNAMRYGDHKPVAVALRSHEGRILLSVKDQGIGIRAESQERIFNRFERAISANDVSGLGLGLFISRQIVEAHGGRIWVESDGPGHGATFFVELPAFPDFSRPKHPGVERGSASRPERRFQGLA